MKKIFQLFVFCLFGISAWANGTTSHMNPDLTCGVSISLDSTNTGDVILIAEATGDAPFAYNWNTGETTETIIVTSWGINYCVTVTDASGCIAESCVFNQNSCTADILTTPTGAMFANAGGVSPFTYTWSDGSTSSTIYPNAAGTYCVTITDVTGCEATACADWNPNPCNAFIVQEDSAGFDILQAYPVSGVSYTWSTGETTNYIVPSSSGTYCVTVTGGGCIGEACYYYHTPNYTISGYLYYPDSLNPQPMGGIVELYFNDTNSNNWELVGTTNIVSDPNGWSNFYDFGAQNPAGQYIVKATLDPNLPNAGDYMPTYHFSTVHWDSANVISLPASGGGLYQIIFNDGSNFSGGDGTINGLVTQGDGFTANDENDRGGDPRPNTSVLLFDSNEQPVTHTVTDDQGQYSFGNLPYGTYKLEVEIVGVEQAVRWVTLSANQPSSTGNDFEVTPDGIVLGINDLVAESKLHISPNPTTGLVNFSFEAKANFDAKISVARADGQTILLENQAVAKGSQSLQLDLTNFPSGLYFLQITTGQEVISRKIVKQ